jgi:hypothetical protein
MGRSEPEILRTKSRLEGGFLFGFASHVQQSKTPLNGAAFIKLSRQKGRHLDFRHCYGFLVAHLNTAFAAQTLLCIHWHRLAVLHFIYIHRANLYAFFASFALVMVHRDFVSHLTSPPIFIVILRP